MWKYLNAEPVQIKCKKDIFNCSVAIFTQVILEVLWWCVLRTLFFCFNKSIRYAFTSCSNHETWLYILLIILNTFEVFFFPSVTWQGLEMDFALSQNCFKTIWHPLWKHILYTAIQEHSVSLWWNGNFANQNRTKFFVIQHFYVCFGLAEQPLCIKGAAWLAGWFVPCCPLP